MSLPFKIFDNEIILSGLYSLWGICIMEMIGIMETNIHRPLGNLILVYTGCYSIYQQIYAPKKDKSKAVNEMLIAFSNEINKAIQQTPKPDEKDEISMYSNDYIKTQMDLIQSSLKTVNEIQGNLSNTSETVSGTHEYNFDWIEDTLFPYNTEDKCESNNITCSSEQHFPESVQSPRRGRSREPRQLYESRSRSRSRDCDHDMVRVVGGYDDIYDKCTKCNYENCR